MDILWMIIGSLFIVAGFIGCFLPMLPGPPLAYVGLLIQQLRSSPAFTTKQLLIWLAVVAAVTVLDYWIPIYGTKKFGGTKSGVWERPSVCWLDFSWGRGELSLVLLWEHLLANFWPINHRGRHSRRHGDHLLVFFSAQF